MVGYGNIRVYERMSEQLRLLSCIAIVASFLLLLPGWAEMTGDSKYDISEYRDDIIGITYFIENIAYSLGDGINMDAVRGFTSSLLDGKITGMETYPACRGIYSFFKIALVHENDGSSTANMLQNIMLYTIVYRFVFIASLVSGIIVFWYRLQKKITGWEQLYLVSRLVLFLMTFLLVYVIKEEIEVELGATVWSVLAVLTAVPSRVLQIVPIDGLWIEIEQTHDGSDVQTHSETMRYKELEPEKKEQDSSELLQARIDMIEKLSGEKRSDRIQNNSEKDHLVSEIGKNTIVEPKPMTEMKNSNKDSIVKDSVEYYFFCTECGKKISSKMKYCVYCGHKAER